MKKYICDITGKEVSGSDYVEVRTYNSNSRDRHGDLISFKVEGFDRELEPELEQLYRDADRAADKAKTEFIEKALARLRKGK
jgi:hypothetical protein